MQNGDEIPLHLDRNGEIVDVTDDEEDPKTRERLVKAGYCFITEQEAKKLREQISR